MRRLLLSVGIVSFSVMFAISVVGPLLSKLAETDNIPLGGHPNTSIGVIFALGGLTLALFQVPFARMADRMGRRRFITAGSIGVGVFILMLGYSRLVADSLGLSFEIKALGWDASTLLLALFRSLQGAAAAATWPVLMAVLAALIPPERMGTAMGVFGASFGLGMSLGPVLGPALASIAGIHSPFQLSFILALLAALASMLIPESRGARPKRRVGGVRDPLLIALSLTAFSLLYCMGALVVIYPKYMTDTLGLGMDEVAVAMALAGLTYTFLQPLTGRVADMVDKRLLVATGLPLAGLAVALAGSASTTTVIYASMLLFGVSGSLAFPASNALVGIIAPRGREGAYTGVYNAMLSLGVMLSPIVVGYMADASGYRAAFLTPLILSLAVTTLFTWIFTGWRGRNIRL